MEKLQKLLKEYNSTHLSDLTYAPWNKIYCEKEFPKYWKLIYSILKTKNKNSRIIEIGCGLGDVTSILCYLGFINIKSFEKDKNISICAQTKISSLFNKNNIIINKKYPDYKSVNIADILILVNCVYGNNISNKKEYLNLLYSYYSISGNPKYFILETIDSSYTVKDIEFPKYLRLCEEDIKYTFCNSKITSWLTYKYPINRHSKKLYLIENMNKEIV